MYPGVRSDPFWDDRVRGLDAGDFSSPTPIRQTIRSQLTLSARRQTPILSQRARTRAFLPSSSRRHHRRLARRHRRSQRGRRVVAPGLNFPELGRHQCPSEKQVQTGLVIASSSLSHVPNRAQTGARIATLADSVRGTRGDRLSGGGSRIRTFRPSRDQCLSELVGPCAWRPRGVSLWRDQ